MSFNKFGEAMTVESEDFKSFDDVLADQEILSHFDKVASELKTIAPKAKDFLYFSAVMMHAAEASLLDDNGELRKGASGDPVTAHWDKSDGTWRWVCSDSNIQPYRNSNRDIFPEEELIKAHKDWVGKPLCLDHKSSSVDMIRGVIVDTYYDYPRKRVVALCALDKANYPDLAHKVTSRCATCVSMGTAVGRAICTEPGCHKVARTEADFCEHMRTKSAYGEINVDLKPIELSIVVNGADPKAKIRHIVASAASSIAKYVSQKENDLAKVASEKKIDLDAVSAIKMDLDQVVKKLAQLELTAQDTEVEQTESNSDKLQERLTTIAQEVQRLQQTVNTLQNKKSEDTNMTDKKAYHLGGGGVNDPANLPYPKEDYQTNRDKNDKQMVGAEAFPDVGPVDGLYPGDKEKKEKLLRADDQAASGSMKRRAIVERAKEALKNKKAYHLGGGGVNDPANLPYPKEDYTQHRDKEDKQMVGAGPFPDVGPVDGLYPGDKEKKEKVSRAKLVAKFIKAANADGSDNQGDSRWQVYADNKLILTATVDDLTGGSEVLYDSVSNKEFGRKILATLRTDDFQTAKSKLLKKAQDMPGMDMGGDMGDMGEEEPMDLGGTGDLKEQLPALLDQAENVLADIRAGIDALMDEPGDELAELSEVAEEMPVREASLLKKKLRLQQKVGSIIADGMTKAAAQLESNVQELSMGQAILDSDNFTKAELQHAAGLTAAAAEDTKETLAGCYDLMESFVRFANGTEAIMKKATDTTGYHMDGIDTGPLFEAKRRGLPDRKPSRPIYNPVRGEGPHSGGGYRKGPEETFEFEEGGYMEDARPGVRPGLGLELDTDNPYDADDMDDLDTMLAMMGDDDAMMADDEHDAKTRKPKAPQMRAKERGEGSGGAHSGRKGVRDMTPEEIKEHQKKIKMKPIPRPDSNKADSNDANDASRAKEIQVLKEMLKQMPHGPVADEARKRLKKLEEEKDSHKAATMELNSGKKVEIPVEDLDKLNSTASIVVEASAEDDFDLTTKAGRAALRAKLAKKGLEGMDTSPHLHEAHPEGGVTTQLDTKPTGDLAKVETLEEAKQKHMEVATAPPRVRQAAEEIHRLVVAGAINPETDFEGLIANGLDADAVKYYKEYFGQGDSQSSQFAAELVKEHHQKKMAEAIKANEVKVSRAYDMAYAMADRGMIGSDRAAVSEQVKEIMTYDEKSFQSLARLVENMPLQKQASAMPQVGMMESTGAQVVIPAPPAPRSGGDDLFQALNAAFSDPNYKPRNF
jgi:hypothetical protein